ncbi:MAG TPA: 2-amino-4-hydroxy-6-hydroxymethyldihydropteridine diphosphokinase [Edaphobacter sp.]|nr:2-amino-4-hydroxy-6-hydroxymethyldihydropteridine diphosphokinase [Edaphobacter sp.]
MGLAAIALGSNLSSKFGDRDRNLHEAIRRLKGFGDVEAVSSFYDTEPVGYTEQPRFLNGAVTLKTSLSSLELMRALLTIEREMGRERGIAKGPRVIDLDLLFYGSEIANTAELTLPHPEMQNRRFVLEPLAEIATDWVHPVLGSSVEEMLRRMG